MDTIGTITARLNKELGLIIRESRVRQYIKWGLIPVVKGKNKYNYFDDKIYQQAKLVFMLSEIGVPINDIKLYLDGDKTKLTYIQERMQGVDLCVLLLKKLLRGN